MSEENDLLRRTEHNAGDVRTGVLVHQQGMGHLSDDGVERKSHHQRRLEGDGLRLPALDSGPAHRPLRRLHRVTISLAVRPDFSAP